MTSRRSHLAYWLTVAIVFYLLLAGSALTMWLRPQLYYWRAWEYFTDIVYRCQGVEPLWEGREKGDRSRDFYMLYQQWRPTRVSTDGQGFRATPLASPAYPLAVLGDSTIFGSGLSDHETLPWRLALELGLPVFNGARSAPGNALARPELAQVRLVIEGRTEAALGGLTPMQEPEGGLYRPLRQGHLGVLESAPLALYFWPARVLRDLERLGNDLAYLRQHRGQLPPRLLKRHQHQPADLERAVAAAMANQRFLAARGAAYVFLPVPSAQTLYAPDVDGFTRDFIPRLCRRLRQEGVHTLDLATPFLEHKDEDLFIPTDTHWNGRATALASRELAAYLRLAGLLTGLEAPRRPSGAGGN